MANFNEQAMTAVVNGFFTTMMTDAFQSQMPAGTPVFMLNRPREVDDNRYNILPIQVINQGLYERYKAGASVTASPVSTTHTDIGIDEILSGFVISDTPLTTNAGLMQIPQTALVTAGFVQRVKNIWGDNVQTGDVVGFVIAMVKGLRFEPLSAPRGKDLPAPEKGFIPQLIPVSQRVLENIIRDKKALNSHFKMPNGARITNIVKFIPFGRITFVMKHRANKRSLSDLHDQASHFKRSIVTGIRESYVDMFIMPCV